MDALIHEGKTFTKINYSGKQVKNREFEKCIFLGCDLSDSNFSQNRFSDCQFIGCNLAMLKLNHSTLDNVHFKECKLTGINFSECESFLFSVGFEQCILDYASFMNRKMPKTHFNNSSLKNVSFENANLEKAVFENTDLAGAVFDRTMLKEADLSTAFNYTIDPEQNNIRKARFALQGVAGLLAKYDIRIA
ncbi:pentapeptide repeat-containing protein [Pontibacter vulgaris]|uniref:pentapeptide repeat-containing protein n=1 Tax=Pontibacter vulgaris TaxID=2905679 RepID=UPI001FA7A510|nr:pentapeptide repeat-containing protein [Pontibacter vulgaris]